MNPHKGQQSWSPSANIGAEFAASSPEIQSAMKNYKQFWAALSDADRAKLEKVHKLLKHYRNRGAPMASDREAELLIEKAVQEAHVDQELFDRWWTVLVPVLTLGGHSDFALLLMWSKLAPGILRGDPLGAAKLAANDLRHAADRIYEEARHGNERFFIELGKCLSGEIKRDLVDAIDKQMLRILSINPSMSAKEAVRRLALKGYQITEENFRVRKQRLKAGVAASRTEYDQSQQA